MAGQASRPEEDHRLRGFGRRVVWRLQQGAADGQLQGHRGEERGSAGGDGCRAGPGPPAVGRLHRHPQAVRGPPQEGAGHHGPGGRLLRRCRHVRDQEIGPTEVLRAVAAAGEGGALAVRGPVLLAARADVPELWLHHGPRVGDARGGGWHDRARGASHGRPVQEQLARPGGGDSVHGCKPEQVDVGLYWEHRAQHASDEAEREPGDYGWPLHQQGHRGAPVLHPRKRSRALQAQQVPHRLREPATWR
mmetsp:Transcript_33889/g.95191  ORF Transcript_33889/g.95191 Transcript_33889/m.95191 type:complete len:248 (+) Transcript_33889:282-1025(+)